MNETKPEGSQVFFDGSYYKLGLHDLTYRWGDTEWVRSTKTPSEVKAAIARHRKDYK